MLPHKLIQVLSHDRVGQRNVSLDHFSWKYDQMRFVSFLDFYISLRDIFSENICHNYLLLQGIRIAIN